MGDSMKHPVEGSVSATLVEYYPDWQILFIETGRKSAAGEEFASDIIVHYDKDEDNEPSFVVAIHIDSAELLLRPFADKVLAKYGVWREPESDRERDARLKRKAALEATAKYPLRKSLPPARVEYNPERDSLFIDSGRAGVVSQKMAENIIVHYDKDKPDERCSAVAIRIDSAERVLEPFVDDILKKHGVEREEEAARTRAQD